MDVGYPESPRLQFRWLWWGDIKGLWKVQSHDALPPSVKVIDQDLHHRVVGPSLFIIALENEGGWPNGENHYIALKNLLEAKRLIKGTTPREILRR